MIYMAYDTETTGFANDPKAETVQFAAKFMKQIGEYEFELLEEVEFKKQVKITDFLLKTGHKQVDYDNGLTKEEYNNEIKRLLAKYKPDCFVGANIREFDNKFIKRELNAPRMLYLLKQHDTLIYERLMLGLNNWSKDKNGRKVSCTVEACCNRHGIEFDPSAAHDALYDVTKTWELFLSQYKIINEENKRDLMPVTEKVYDASEFDFE